MKKLVTFTMEIDTDKNHFDVSMNYLGREKAISCGNYTPENIAWGFRRIIIKAAELAHNVDSCSEFLPPYFNCDALHAQLEKVEFEFDSALD